MLVTVMVTTMVSASFGRVLGGDGDGVAGVA